MLTDPENLIPLWPEFGDLFDQRHLKSFGHPCPKNNLEDRITFTLKIGKEGETMNLTPRLKISSDKGTRYAY